MPRPVALVTGASSGIGREIAKYHAAKGGDLIVTARRAEALDALKAEIEGQGASVTVIALDLGAPGGADDLIAKVGATGSKVDVLVNNAGFGGRGNHADRDIAEERAMVDLNVMALMTLTHHFANDMAARGGGRILNVGSTAGFMPGPSQAVYFATKAFVNSYSQAVDHEMRPKGVTVTVLAPGYVETEFADRADLTGTKLTKSGATAESVAKFGYDAMMKGELVAINDRKLAATMRMLPVLPRRRVLKMVADMQAK